MRRPATSRISALHIDTHSLLATHSIAVQQLVAISRAMVTDSTVLVLDEPTSSLDRTEVEQLFGVMRGLRDRGVAILFVTHFLDQVYEISDRLTVLRNGALVGEYLAADLPRGALISHMIGRELDELEALSSTAVRTIDRTRPFFEGDRPRPQGHPRASTSRSTTVRSSASPGCSAPDAPSSCASCTEPTAPTRARSSVRGEASRIANPRHAIDQRIAFSSEDRRAEGIIGDLTVAENIVLGIQAKRGWLRKMRKAEQAAVVDEYIAALGVRPADPNRLVRNLSGGNQQKVLLARWLATAPAADHPGRADPRHRRRREGRHPAQGRRSSRARDCRWSSSPPSSRRCCASPNGSS